jgi:hypothetical protein
MLPLFNGTNVGHFKKLFDLPCIYGKHKVARKFASSLQFESKFGGAFVSQERFQC